MEEKKGYRYRVGKGDVITKWMVSELEYVPYFVEKKPYVNCRVNQLWSEVISHIRINYIAESEFEKREFPKTLCSKVYFPLEGEKVQYSRFWHIPHKLDFVAESIFYAEEEGEFNFEIYTCGGVKVNVNGAVKEEFYSYLRNQEQGKKITLFLKKGENKIRIACNDLAERDTQFYFKLKHLSDRELEIIIPVECQEKKLEEAVDLLDSIYIEKLNYSDNEIYLKLTEESKYDMEILLKREPFDGFIDEHGEREKNVFIEKGQHEIYIGDLCDSGTGIVNLKIEIQTGDILINKNIEFEYYPTAFEKKDIHLIKERKKYALEFLAKYGRRNLQKAIAIIEADGSLEKAKELIEYEMARINSRVDCADFRLPALIYIYKVYKYKKIFEEELMEKIKRCILDFRYWFDEPGNDVMWFFSENHALNFHVSELLAGEIFEDEVFTNCGMTGKEHKEKAEKLLNIWFKNFFEQGYNEWNSSVYIPIDLIGFFALYIMTENQEIKQKSLDALDITFKIFADNSYKGTMAASYGRTYFKNLIGPKVTETSALNWIAYGEGYLNEHVFSTVLFAVSEYEPKPRIAEDSENRSIQGEERVSLYNYRTKNYIMASVGDYKAGKAGSQEHVFHLMLNNCETQLWINHPGESKIFGSGRPSYFAGNGTLPKVNQIRNVACIEYKLLEQEVQYTHAFCPLNLFDERVGHREWLFLRKGETYLGIYAENGIEITAKGPLTNYELISQGKENFWLVALGEKGEYKDFNEFQKHCRTNDPKRYENKISYNDKIQGNLIFEYESRGGIDYEV